MHVAQPRRGRASISSVEQFLSRRVVHALDRVGVRGDVEREAAVDRIFPHQPPALGRQRRALLGAGEIGRDLAARIGVIVPGEEVFQLLAQRRREPLEGQPRRDEFGFAAATGMIRADEHRGQRGHALERTVGMPQLIGLVAQRQPMVSGTTLPFCRAS